ncbi:unnamed protein product [Moneuplotes crassus]|uniref:Uncharacterized protein n=1 Tax=Euplotes crassus TaxID=5936 RepID=A0AAD2D693_EUPCR|nr:unnamed protein product [Moneuplotes crassus]
MALGGKTERYRNKHKAKLILEPEEAQKYSNFQYLQFYRKGKEGEVKEKGLGSSHYLANTKMKHYFGEKTVTCGRGTQKIIQMKKNLKKAEGEKTFSSTLDGKSGAKETWGCKESKVMKKSTKYLKIRSNTSGSYKSKVSTKSTKGSSNDTIGKGTYSSLQKMRKGSVNSANAINSGRTSSIKDMKQNSSLRNSIKHSSVKKEKNKENRSPNGQRKYTDSTRSNASLNSAGSKPSIKGNLNRKFSQEKTFGNNKSNYLLRQKEHTSSVLSTSDAGSFNIAKANLGSMVSLNSAGSSSIKSGQGRKEEKKVTILNKHLKKEFGSNNDKKVYSYKLNQLISVIKSSKDEGGKSITKTRTMGYKKSSNRTKKTCIKVLKTNRKNIRKMYPKSSVTVSTPKNSSIVHSEHSAVSGKKTSKRVGISKLNDMKRHKVIKKLGNQITKNLDINKNNYTEKLKSTRSPHKKGNMILNRKKPPLIKAGGSENGSRMLRYPSNASSKRECQSNTSDIVKNIIVPCKGKSSSQKRVEKTPLIPGSTQSRIGVPNINSLINPSKLKNKEKRVRKNHKKDLFDDPHFFSKNFSKLCNYNEYQKGKSQNRRYGSEGCPDNYYSKMDSNSKENSSCDLKASRLEFYSSGDSIPDNECPEGETKTQNTQDYRKDHDLAIEDLNFNYSAEKAIQRITRIDIDPELFEIPKASDVDESEIPDEVSRKCDKTSFVMNKYTNPVKGELRYEPANEQGVSQMDLSFPEIKFEEIKESLNSQSFDNWSPNQQENIDEFLKGGNNNSLSNLSLKDSERMDMTREISCDNPLELDDEVASKKLELADLEVKRSIQDLTETQSLANSTKRPLRYTPGDHSQANSQENDGSQQSRNREEYLSRDNSSICNFKSIDYSS